MRGLSVALVCGFVSLFGATAHAQEPASPPPLPPAAQQPPDVVLLNNGGMFRGTISERVPNDYVLLITATGEQRKFSMTEVKYAGPASEMPTSAPAAPATAPPAPPRSVSSGSDKVKPFATIHGQEARLKLEATQPGITFHRRSGSATAGNIVATGFDDLCSAPCEVSMPAGTHVLALSKGTDSPLEASDPIQVPPGPSTVRGEIVDKSGIRTAGWVVGAGGVGVGLYLVLTADKEVEKCDSLGCETQEEPDTTKFLVGTTIMTVGLVAGYFMIATQDGASITVTPGTPAALGRSPRLDARRFVDLGGLTATANF